MPPYASELLAQSNDEVGHEKSYVDADADVDFPTPLCVLFFTLRSKKAWKRKSIFWIIASLQTYFFHSGLHVDDAEKGSVNSYFQYYGKLANQQNMLQDSVRTVAYLNSVQKNPSNFYDKVVMDVGAGSGILSYFSAMAGAKRVWAVEASNMAKTIEKLADSNGLGHSITVVNSMLENIPEAQIPSQSVDMIISEPIGTFLFNERMIETFLHARDRFLKPGGKLFPNKSDLCLAPFSDATLHWEQMNKQSFWKTTNFYGVDLSAVQNVAVEEQSKKGMN